MWLAAEDIAVDASLATNAVTGMGASDDESAIVARAPDY